MKNTVRFEHVPFNFISLYLVVLTFAMKLKLKRFKYFSILSPMKNDVKFEYVPWKMSDFLSFPLFRFSLVIKLRNFDVESH